MVKLTRVGGESVVKDTKFASNGMVSGTRYLVTEW